MERNRTERNISMELLRHKIRNGTSQIVSCNPSDRISTYIRHYSYTEMLYKVFYSIIYAHCTSYFTERSYRTEAFAGYLWLGG